MGSAHVREITAATFQQDVVEGSMQSPILLDFWAAWCGPCRTLGPVLEKLADRYGGAFRLGKVDTEREQDLAYAFGVQGIPFGVLIRDGRPVGAFQGALPEAEVVAFLERNGVRPGADEAPEEAPEADPDSPAARIAEARAAAASGDVARTRDALAGIPEEDPVHDEAERLAAGLAWLEAELSDGAGEASRQLAEARRRFLARDLDGAMDGILASVAADRDFRDGLARRAMLLCFAVVGEQEERLDDYRRRLATLLY